MSNPRYEFMRTPQKLLETPESIAKEVFAPQQTLDEIGRKKKLKPMDYIVLLSTMYGIGSGIGIIAGTAKSVLPSREVKPLVYYTCILLLIAGATRGYLTASQSQKLKHLLQQINLTEKE